MSIAPPPARPRLTLLESGRVSTVGHQAAVTGSVVSQVVVVCAAAVLLSRTVPPLVPALDERASFLAPLRQEHPRPVQEALTYTALGGVSAPVSSSELGETRAPTTVKDLAVHAPVTGGDERPREEALSEEATRLFSEIEVDSAVVRDPESAGPVYPPALMAKGIEGSVLASFVVDAMGRPDISTYFAIESTDTAFTRAVLDALPHMKFRAAKRSNKPVRQQVEMRFRFNIKRVGSSGY